MPNLNRQQLAEHVGKLISAERNGTHGDPHEQFACQQEFWKVICIYGKAHPEWKTEYHVLQMITTKLSRIICGSNLQDHWLDIAGYALIAAEKAEKPLAQT